MAIVPPLIFQGDIGMGRAASLVVRGIRVQPDAGNVSQLEGRMQSHLIGGQDQAPWE